MRTIYNYIKDYEGRYYYGKSSRKHFGGKYIDKGSYKCVFRPSIKCKDEDKRYGEDEGEENQYISAIMSIDAVEKESSEMDKINVIDPDNSFTLGGIVNNCEIGDLDETEEAESELSKCGLLYSPDKRNIIMRYGGVSLNIISKNLSDFEEVIPGLYYNFDILLDNLITLRENHFCHADIKPQNILYNIELTKYNLIDFSLSFDEPVYNRGINNIFARKTIIDSNTIMRYIDYLNSPEATKDPLFMYDSDISKNIKALSTLNKLIITDDHLESLFSIYNHNKVIDLNNILTFTAYAYWPIDIGLSMILQVYIKHKYQIGIRNLFNFYPDILKTMGEFAPTATIIESDIAMAQRFVNASFSKFDSFSIGVVMATYYTKDELISLIPNGDQIKKIIENIGLDLMEINPLKRITLENAKERYAQVKELLLVRRSGGGGSW